MVMISYGTYVLNGDDNEDQFSPYPISSETMPDYKNPVSLVNPHKYLLSFRVNEHIWHRSCH